ncbi:MAG: ABC transporter ATP-binding protein [Deltaproteobacteria bacterium CG11_big_fil_rev_8_21_14_0_20_45_16]|nr:MAG: ABC transporter ATP-binding protein [Deltaproteobacteria bacterium CG11_big_fil_rev_8_21_14_0_20_45_16]
MSVSPKNLLQLQEGAKSFGSRSLFADATFSVNEDEHIGVIGPNGAGKTTLFKILADELELDDGKVVRSGNLRLGYLKQHDVWNLDQTVEEFLSQGTSIPIWELKKMAVQLGLTDAQFEAPIRSLSGGYRMRAKLLHLLGEEPNLMMLDEPTNYLDLETLLVLEEFLQSFKGAFLLISHDREFLRRTTDHILEIENGDFVKFSGNIDDYFEQKQMLREQLQKQVMSQSAKRQEVLDFAARFGAKATKARQVQSRLKQLSKMETIELKALPVTAKIRIPPPIHTGRMTLEIEDADLGYPDKIIIQGVNLKIEKGDHIGVVGFNGAGKTTLLRSLAMDLDSLYGKVAWGYQVEAAYYAQHVAERLSPDESVHEALARTAHRDVKDQEILDIAGSLLFSGDAVRKKASVLSGGEKARVALGQMLLKKSPLLILDEPTNHLDFYTVEALTQALEKFEGTIIFVSHDRGFVRRIATKILEVRNGELHLFPGPYDEYVWNVQRYGNQGSDKKKELKIRHRDQLASSKPERTLSTNAAEESPDKKQKVKELESDKKQIEKNLQDLDKKIKILESRMIDQSTKLASLHGQELNKLSIEIGASQRKIHELEAEFLLLMEQKDSLTGQISDLKSS